MECPHIPEISYGDFSKRLHEKVVAKRIPIGGGIELTMRCNLNCLHCYCAYDSKRKELTTAEIFKIIDDIAEEGCLWFLITGGEPLVRKDFLDIYTYAKKKGMFITLFTNGTLIDEKMADYLAEWRPFSVEISLYGATSQTYEKITQAKGSFERAIKGIELLLERKIPLKLKTMVLRKNKHELQMMEEYAESLGVEFRYDPMINPCLDGSLEVCKTRLPPEEVVALDVADQKRLDSWKEFCDKFWGAPNTDYLYNCGAGLNSFHINSYGEMSVCVLSREPGYNLLQGSFKEGWYQEIPKVRAKKPKGDYRCGKCQMISLCGQCPGWALLETGDEETSIAYLCEVAHLRAEAFGLLDKETKAEAIQTTT